MIFDQYFTKQCPCGCMANVPHNACMTQLAYAQLMTNIVTDIIPCAKNVGRCPQTSLVRKGSWPRCRDDGPWFLWPTKRALQAWSTHMQCLLYVHVLRS